MVVDRDGRVRELAAFFLRLGVTAFGGPAAHMAMMREEVVRRRAWLTEDEFLDLLGASNLIPGPSSTEMAIHIGLRRAGWRGLVVAGACFILPAALIAAALGWAYVRYGALPQGAAIFYGLKPAIVAIVAQALWGLARTAVKSAALGALGVAATVAAFAAVNPALVLLAGGALAAAVKWGTARRKEKVGFAAGFAAPVLGGAAPALGLAPVALSGLFVIFLKVGALVFGSGYVLLAFLRADLVDRLHWLTESQLMDAIAVGQFTPGPVFTTATFIGYVLHGGAGAAVATLGIFAPAFVYVAASGWLVPRLRRSPAAGAFLNGANVAALALMAAVTWTIARAAIVDLPTAALAAAAAALLLRFRVNSLWLILAGALAGLVRWGLSS